MRPIRFVRCLILATFAVLASLSAIAQTTTPPSSTAIPFMRAGFLGGRNGVAIGGSGILELNPLQSFGVYLIGGRSAVHGYTTDDPDVGKVTANEYDWSGGGGFIVRAPAVHHSLRAGAFAQFAYTRSHVNAHYGGPFPGGYTDSSSGLLFTPGVQVEFAPRPGILPTFCIRAGRNFGDGLAATTANGIYVAGGPTIDAVQGFKRVRSTFKNLF